MRKHAFLTQGGIYRPEFLDTNNDKPKILEGLRPCDTNEYFKI